jgi:hypothetical protein
MTELLADKRLGRWRAETVNELCRARLELEQRGLKNSPEYRDAVLRADQQAWRLVEWARAHIRASGVRFLCCPVAQRFWGFPTRVPPFC